MNKTVIIQCDDQGQYAVGEEPANEDQAGGGDEGAEQQALEPAKDLDDALAKAKALFAQSEQQSGADNEAAFQQGFQGVAGGGSPAM